MDSTGSPPNVFIESANPFFHGLSTRKSPDTNQWNIDKPKWAQLGHPEKKRISLKTVFFSACKARLSSTSLGSYAMGPKKPHKLWNKKAGPSTIKHERGEVRL
jgi:hypothetical protein